MPESETAYTVESSHNLLEVSTDFNKVDELLGGVDEKYFAAYAGTAGKLINDIGQDLIEAGVVTMEERDSYHDSVKRAVNQVIGIITEPLSRIWIARRAGNDAVATELESWLEPRHEEWYPKLQDPRYILAQVGANLQKQIIESEGHAAQSGDQNFRDVKSRRLQEINSLVQNRIDENGSEVGN